MSSPWKADLCGIGPAILIEDSIITAAAYKGSATLDISGPCRDNVHLLRHKMDAFVRHA
jgi:hypothetical protein